jgi:adenylate kinase family enzyme
VLGPGGAGKSELAAALAQVTGLPVVHLDRIFWRGGWEAAPADEARRELANAVEAERWILDGNFLDADDDRFARADTVLFLDMPRRVCLRQVLWRLLRDRRRSRPDLPEGCRETLDLELLRWIWRYPRVDRPRVLELSPNSATTPSTSTTSARAATCASFSKKRIMRSVDVLGWLKSLRRERSQLTVELAESGVAPEDEVRATEKRVEHETERRGDHTQPDEPPATP